MSDERNPYESPREEKTRYEKPEMARYRKVASVGARLFLVCGVLMLGLMWKQWYSEFPFSRSAYEELLYWGVHLLVIFAAVAFSGWWLQGWHQHDQDDGHSDP